jgi:hypothetical protein
LSGQSVTLTAHVTSSSGTPTGSVSFYDGTTLLGQSPLSGGTATLSAGFSAGTHNLKATYNGDSTHSSSSGTATQSVSRDSVGVHIIESPTTASYGQPITITAIIDVDAPGSGTPTGDFTFTDNGTVLGTEPLINGEASLTTTALSHGSNDISGTYNGDGNFDGGTPTSGDGGGDGSLPVSTATTTTTVSFSSNPTAYGQSVEITATITPQYSTGSAPTGSVTFTVPGVGTVTEPANGGTATFSTAALPVGASTVTADYSGDGNYDSSSGSGSTTVTRAQTTTSLVGDPSSAVFGQPVTFTATVNPSAPGAGDPTGDVVFNIPGVGEQTVPLVGNVATYTTSALPAGISTVTTNYAGDGNFAASGASIIEAVGQSQTTVDLRADHSPSVYSQPVTFTAKVDPTAPGAGEPTGSIIFNIPQLGAQTVPLVDGAASYTTSGLTVGTTDVTATYSGDGNFAAGSATISQTVTAAPTTTTLTAMPSPSTYGQSVTFTATIGTDSSTAPTGTVTFSEGGNTLDTEPLSGFTATFSTSTLTPGPHTIKVSFSGDTIYLPSNGTGAVTVNDAAPVLTSPGDQTDAEGESVSVPVQASEPDGSTLVFGATGLPAGLTIDSATGLISGVLSPGAAETSGGQYTVTVTAAAPFGASSSQTFTWTVTAAPHAPLVGNPGDQTNVEGDAVSLSVADVGPDAPSYVQPLVYSATGLPDGLTIDPSTGLISGVVAASAAGTRSVTVTATEGSLSANQTFTWTVTDVQIASPGDQTSVEGDTVSVAVSAWTMTGSPLTYSASGLPAGLSIDASSGVISGTVAAGAAAAGPYAVTVTAANGSDTASTTFNWAVAALAVQSPGDQADSEGDDVSLPITVLDNNSTGTVTFSATGLPSGLTIDTATGIISGTVASGDASQNPYQVTVTAVDGGASATRSFSWTVSRILITDPPSQIDAQGDNVSLQIQATAPAGDTLTYGASGLPTGLTISSATGLISGTVASAANGPHAVTVTASDGNETVSDTFQWTISNGAVTITNPTAQSTAEGAAASLQIHASDQSGDSFTYSATGLPSGLTIDPQTGLISGTVNYGASAVNGGSYSVTVLADNGAGATGSTTFTWTVNYTDQAPQVFSPGNQLNSTGDNVSLPVLASSPGGNTLTYTATGLPPGLTIDSGNGIISGSLTGTSTGSPYTVSVTASDGTLSSSTTVAWTVTAGNVTVTNPGDQANAEGDTVTVAASASGYPGLPLTYAASGLPAGLTIDSATGVISGTITYGAALTASTYSVMVTASDAQGHSGGTTFNWAVAATPQAPTLANPGSQANAEGNGVALQLQVTNPYGLTLTYTASGLPAGLTIDPASGLISGTVAYGAAALSGGSYSVTVSVYDGVGHTVSQSFQWAVTHTDQSPWLAPVSAQNNKPGDTVTLSLAAGDPNNEALTFAATGLPDGLTINPTNGQISGTITGAVGQYSVTVTATDGTMTASQSFTWTVTDGEAGGVTLAVNGTTDHSDDVLILGADPVPVVVTLQGAGPGQHTVTLALVTDGPDAGAATLDTQSLELADGGSATVYLTAQEASTEADANEIVAYIDGEQEEAGNNKFTIEKVTMPEHVRADDTPAGMADRIPPRVQTAVNVVMSADLSKTPERVWFKVNGQSANNGEVAMVVTGADGKDKDAAEGWAGLQKSGKLYLRGTTQTAPTADGKGGNAGKLFLYAQVGENAKDSATAKNGFSVAAIPVTVVVSFDKTVTAERRATTPPTYVWGSYYKTTVKSDSGELSDLDQAKVIEVVAGELAGSTGVIRQMISNKQLDFQTTPVGATETLTDLHGLVPTGASRAIAVNKLWDLVKADGNGVGNVLQYIKFEDARTGSGGTITNSGFSIQFRFEALPAGAPTGVFLTVTKTPKANNGAQPGEISEADQKPKQGKVQ